MPTLLRMTTAFCVFFTVLAVWSGAAFSASANMYNADIEGRIELSEDQRAKVLQVLQQSEAELVRILTTNGIDPSDDSPSAMKLFSASSAMSALGKKTRAQLSELLSAEQLQEYDRITAEVEQRIRASVSAPDRPDMSGLR